MTGMAVSTDEQRIDEFLNRSVEEILPEKEALKRKLMSGEQLRIYNGIDPTSPSIHIGNAIILWKLQRLVELGHQVIFLIGSFTAMIGDPSDKKSARQMLTKEQVEENFKEYKAIAGKILDFDQVELVYNGDWLADMELARFMEILSKVTHQQVIERDLFQKRIGEGKEVWMHELMYPMLQGYDSVELDVDLEIGGTDQFFNMMMGRRLQKAFGKREKSVLTVPLIPGTDGRKMSKSYGNTVDLTDEPNDMYGKLMSISDDLIPLYLETCTPVPMERVAEVKEALMGDTNPMELKKELAREVVTLYHNTNAAQEAEAAFQRVVQEGNVPADIPVHTVSDSTMRLLDLTVLADADMSTSEAKRLIQQGAVSVNGEKKTDASEEISLENETTMQVGKRNYYKIVSR